MVKCLYNFISVFCTAYPERFQELLKYLYVIRQGASRCNNLGWKSYDEQYRLKKAANPTSSWADVDMELWLMFINNSNWTISTQQNIAYSNLKCYSFNYSNRCYRQSCIYSHTCIRCNGPHPIITCKSTFNSQPQQNVSNFTSVQRNRFPRSQRSNVNAQNFSFRNPQQFQRPRTYGPPMGQGLHPN